MLSLSSLARRVFVIRGVEWLSLASSSLATFVGLRLLALGQVVGVVFENHVGHGLLALFEDGRVVAGDLPFRKGLAVDVGGHEPFAVGVAQADVLELAAVRQGHRPLGRDLLFIGDADGLSLAVDGEGLEARLAQLAEDVEDLFLRHVGVDHVLPDVGVDHLQAAVGDLRHVLGVLVECLVEHAELSLTLHEGDGLVVAVLSGVLPQADEFVCALPGRGRQLVRVMEVL